MPPELRYVAWLTAGIGGFWAVLLSAEDLLRPTGPSAPRLRERLMPPEPESPFAPPPPPGGPVA